MAEGFDGKVALVTGGSSGIGRASALAFAREGATVVVADVDIEGGEETAHLISGAGGNAAFIRTDVSRAGDVEGLVERTVETYGRLDCAFNNAGIEGTGDSTVDCSEEGWDRVINVNLKGVWLCMKFEIPRLLELGKGAIVNNASVLGLVGARVPDYVASKHGVVGLTRAAALEYAPTGIRINAVCPGSIRTPMIERYIGGDPAIETQMIADEPLGRIGEPEEIAKAVLWLCSEGASFVTGHAMVVDGGYVAR